MNSLHPAIEDAFDEIDAAIFSGDAFHSKDNIKRFEHFMDRWSKAMVRTKEAVGLADHFGEDEYRELELGEEIKDGDVFAQEGGVYPATDTGNGVVTTHHFPHYRTDG